MRRGLVFVKADRGGFDGVADQVDEQLLDLVRVGEEIDVGCPQQPDIQADFETDNALEEWHQRDALENRRRQLRELTVGLHEAVEGLGAVLDNRETALKVPLQHSNRR
ncbi:MAG: hypothetical protein WB622_06205 [Acidobacteriaceae bacterium]